MKRIAALLVAGLLAHAGAHARTVCTLIADARNGATLLEQGDCATRVTPASTFKIAISLMGFDAGVLQDVHTPALPFREGYVDWRPSWRETTDPLRWMTLSVVWYSQQTVLALGEERFQRYADAFDYGNRDLSGDPGKHNGMATAWIASSLRISPREQIAFLGKLVNRKLPVSAHAYAMTTELLHAEQHPGGWDVHGKIGGAGGYGWYVGWAERDGVTRLFARLTEDSADGSDDSEIPIGYRTRDAFLPALPELLQR
jgi:beta-lactamase class D